MTHILLVSKGLIWEKTGSAKTKFSYLRKYFTGDILHSVSVPELVEDDWDGFTLCGCYLPPRMANFMGGFYSAYFSIHSLIRLTFRHYFVKKYECIIARDPIMSGLISAALSKLCRIPFVVEMNGNYANPIAWNEGHHEKYKLKIKAAGYIIPWILNLAGGIRILYPQQLDPYYPRLKIGKQKIACFHEFTQVSGIEPSSMDSNYILSAGTPAYIKGFDILIKAFKLLPPDYDKYKLKLVGWYPQEVRTYLENLAERSPRIQILNPLPHEKLQALIRDCTLVILPSRTEAMGRVILESMAHAKPVIGSNVEGIPHYIANDVEGLVVPPESPEKLADAIKKLLADSSLRTQMGIAGHNKVANTYSEIKYAENYDDLVSSVIKGH